MYYITGPEEWEEPQQIEVNWAEHEEVFSVVKVMVCLRRKKKLSVLKKKSFIKRSM